MNITSFVLFYAIISFQALGVPEATLEDIHFKISWGSILQTPLEAVCFAHFLSTYMYDHRTAEALVYLIS